MNMMVTRRALLGGMALGGAAAFLPGSALAFRADGATLYPATNAFIKGFVDRRELAGTLACIGKGQEAPLSFGAGAQAMDSAKPVGPDTLRRLSSMTKPTTAMAAQLLNDEGQTGPEQSIDACTPPLPQLKSRNEEYG